MATLTLRRMAEGGLNDQLGGGFCRYSVDEYWMIPHFEKMLYDNGALLGGVRAGGARHRRRTTTRAWRRRPPTGCCARCSRRQGGYYSSLDADSEGHEGKFYVWDREEVRGGAHARRSSPSSRRATGSTAPANFEGHWHLYVATPARGDRRGHGSTSPRGRGSCSPPARAKLLALRDARVRPARDEKILTSWNALMIRGMAIAARALARDDLADSAARALDFIRSTLWRDGRLLATYMDGEAHLNAYLDDYVYLVDAHARAAAGALPRRRARASRASCWRWCCALRGRGGRRVSTSPPTITRRSSTAPRPSATTPRRRQRHRRDACCCASATCSASRATSPPPSARCAPRGRR